MEENRFFRFIWRVNGVALMLLLLLLIGFAGYSFIKEIFRDQRPAVIKNVAADPQGQEKWTLGRPDSIEGTQFIYIPLVSEKKDIEVPKPGLGKAALRSYGDDYLSNSRNLLFINTQTRDMKWLFKDNRQLVTQVTMLPIRKRNDMDRKVDAILYHVISKDTNGDGKLTQEDSESIAISNADGTHYKEFFQSVERVLGTTSLSGGNIMVLYQSNGKGYASTIRLDDMSVIDTREMPKTEKIPDPK